MVIDGLTLHYAVNEIANEIVGSKVDKVQQPLPSTLLISLRAPGKNTKLLICAGAFDSRMHLSTQKIENPKKPPMFCMFLRKHISSAKMEAVSQDGLERVVNITLIAKDELGLSKRMTLVCELMGKHSNVILVSEDGLIMDSLKHVTNSLSRVRQVIPSLPYELPRSDKLNMLTASQATLTEMLAKRGEKKIEPYLSELLQGVSRQTAQEIIFRYMPGGYADSPLEPEKLASAIVSFVGELKNLSPKIYFFDEPFFYSPILYDSVAYNKIETAQNVNDMLDSFYKSLADAAVINKKRASLHKKVAKRIDKLSYILQQQHSSMEKAKKASKYKDYGDMITANIYRIERGMRLLEAQDFYTGEDLQIPLDERLSPAANAQLNYKKYNKRKAGLPIIAKRMSANTKEIAFLESVQISLDNCERLDELVEIEYELSKAGVISTLAAKTKATQQPSSPYKFVSSDGYTIYAGKNNRQNDELTMKSAQSTDIWLHTKDIPGSHVVIVGTDDRLPDTTLLEAAAIAAILSKAKGSLKVPVDYAPRKNVHKPNGSKPGYVVYEGYNTVIVDPDKELFDKLLVK